AAAPPAAARRGGPMGKSNRQRRQAKQRRRARGRVRYEDRQSVKFPVEFLLQLATDACCRGDGEEFEHHIALLTALPGATAATTAWVAESVANAVGRGWTATLLAGAVRKQ